MSFIPVNEPLLEGNESKYLAECVEQGWLSSEGPFVARFEDAVARDLGRAHGIAVSSGSGALEVAVAALRLGPGEYLLDVAVHACDGTPFDYRRQLASFSVTAPVRGVGVYFPEHEWSFSNSVAWEEDEEPTAAESRGN